MLKLAREQRKKNHGAQADMADVSRPTLLRYLLLHLLLSTAIAWYRQRVVVSQSFKLVGKLDKQVAEVVETRCAVLYLK